MMSEKEKWIEENLSKIKSKGLKVPFKINVATTITDLDKYLDSIKNTMLHTENKRILKLFVDKINELLEL